jgi:hypothetical protein
MAQHGYLREYDEGWDRGDDRDRDWRERSDRDWRDRDPIWRSDRESHRDRSRGFMLSDDDRDHSRGRHEDRGFFSRIGDETRSWFGDDDRRDRNFGERRSYSANPDDHYRSWRDHQMQSLDRDYQDYCREREQQFHKDFDAWRQNRQQNRGLRGQWGAEQGSGPDEQTFTPQTTAVGNTMTTSETHEPQTTTEPEDTATLGTTLGRKR